MRRDLVAQQEAQAQPTPAVPGPQQQPAAVQQAQRTPPQTQRTAQRRPLDALRQASAQVAPVLFRLTENQIAQMELPELQTALADTNGNLANELNQFSSAASWQRFFEMPAGVIDQGTIDVAALQTALGRFENVAANPKFAQISSLPSFEQSRVLLSELITRADSPRSEGFTATDGPQLINPSGAVQASAETVEALPAPAPQPAPKLPRNEGEHSILLRTPKS